MTREEAIKLLDMLHGMIEDNLGSDYDTAFKMAIEALGEPIPKKIKNKTKRPNAIYGNCPICNRTLLKENYCPRCGQALDWSDENERTSRD